MLTAAGRLGEAIEIERLVVSHHPHYEDGYLRLVKLLKDNGQRQYAIEASKIAAQNNPQSPRCQFNLAMLLQEAGNLAEAKLHLLAAIELDPGSENFRLKLARLHEEMGETDLAAEVFRPMVEAPAVSHTASRQYAGFLVRREKFQYATVEIERLMARFPEDDTLARLGERARRGLRSAGAAG